MVTATATVAVLLAATIIAAGIRRAGAQNRSFQLRAEKAQVYKLFIGLWEEVLRPGQTAEAVGQLSQQMQHVGHLLMLYGCTTVVKAHAAMQQLDLPEARAQLADALLAMRKDLGLESRGLQAKDLVQLLLSESDQTGRSSRPGSRQDIQPRVSLVSNS